MKLNWIIVLWILVVALCVLYIVLIGPELKALGERDAQQRNCFEEIANNICLSRNLTYMDDSYYQPMLSRGWQFACYLDEDPRIQDREYIWLNFLPEEVDRCTK